MKGPKIAVVDYGMGNLRSVQNALAAVGATGDIVATPEALAGYDRVILPGVGAFREAIGNLRRSGLDGAMADLKERGIPILGICLGMQLMCSTSAEEGSHTGLGWVNAAVRRFPDRPGRKVPHIGWNDLTPRRPHPLLAGLPPQADVYFVHSYRVECADPEDVLATSDYGGEFTAAFGRGNVLGIQFHPEKSQRTGLRILKNFAGEQPC